MSPRALAAPKRAPDMTGKWEQYGNQTHVRPGSPAIFLWRKGQRCRWVTANGVQVGPEQSNVAPACAWALQSRYAMVGGLGWVMDLIHRGELDEPCTRGAA